MKLDSEPRRSRRDSMAEHLLPTANDSIGIGTPSSLSMVFVDRPNVVTDLAQTPRAIELAINDGEARLKVVVQDRAAKCAEFDPPEPNTLTLDDLAHFDVKRNIKRPQWRLGSSVDRTREPEVTTETARALKRFGRFGEFSFELHPVPSLRTPNVH